MIDDTLTVLQLRCARHALGIANSIDKKTYRNRYWVAKGSALAITAAWKDLVARGYAVKQDRIYRPDNFLVCYSLTRAGAEAVLEPGESLDPEDFPE